jgi:adenosylcobinamide-phosphate synthase
MLMAWAACRVNGSACLAWDGLAGAAWPLAALVALAVDRLWGEPAARWHPVVGMGAYLAWAGRRFAPLAGSLPGGSVSTFAKGATAWTLGALMVLALAWAVDGLTGGLPWWAWVLAQGACLKPMLAWRMLRDEVQAVETALGGSLAAGRERLSRLVSRNVAQLAPAQVRESAIETLAENLNDSVVAPLFWFAVAGLPGAALYRFANTADAMWGYRGERQGRDWTWAGKWAARADNVLSWLPARITALLLGLQAAGAVFGRLPSEAGRTPSPNSGWPMAAMALALGVRLSKPGVYTLNAGGRAPAAADMARALVLAGRAVGLLVGLAALAALALLWLTGRAA